MTSDINSPLISHCLLFTMALKGMEPAVNTTYPWRSGTRRRGRLRHLADKDASTTALAWCSLQWCCIDGDRNTTPPGAPSRRRCNPSSRSPSWRTGSVSCVRSGHCSRGRSHPDHTPAPGPHLRILPEPTLQLTTHTERQKRVQLVILFFNEGMNEWMNMNEWRDFEFVYAKCCNLVRF